jgi:cytochrome c556
MRSHTIGLALALAVLATSMHTQQAPAPAPQGRGTAQQQPLVPLAASTVAAHAERYTGTMVTVTAAVGERYGDTSFSLTAHGRSGADELLVVAPLLTAPVKPGAYVTVLGEVVKFDPAAVAAKMKDAAPPADVAAKYTGRPAILASSVINESMTDLAKKLPPPMTPQELELNKAMKTISPAFTALRQAVTASNTSEAGTQAAEIAKGFTAAAAFWKAQPHPDATQWTEDARKIAEEIAATAGRGDLEGVKAAVPKLQQVCGSCHTPYRVRLDDGSYRYKDAVPK